MTYCFLLSRWYRDTRILNNTEYYACATGEAAPKPKASARNKKGGSASSTTLPIPIATPTPTTTVVAAPGLSAAVKEIPKIDEQEATESGEGADEETESDGESKEEDTTEKEDESFDPIPRTSEESEDDDNDEEDQGLRISDEERMQEEEEADELYHRVKSLEDNFSEFRRTNQSPEAVSIIPGIVHQYIHQEITEAVREVVQTQTDRLQDSIQRENDEFLRTIDDDMKKIIKEQKILIDKMEGNKSIQRSDEQRNLYKALVEAYDADKTILDSYGESAILKRRREDDDQEGPSAGSDRGSKRRREGGEHASAKTPFEQLPRVQAELEYHLEEVYKATTDQLDWVNPEGQQYPHNLLQPLPLISDNRGRHVIPFEHFINNDLEYLRGGASSRKYTTSVNKTKAADYGHIKSIEDLVPLTISMTPTVTDQMANSVALVAFGSTRTIMVIVSFKTQWLRSPIWILLSRPSSVGRVSILPLVFLLLVIILPPFILCLTFSKRPGLQSMTPTTSNSGLVSNLILQQPCTPPPRDNWDLLFQPMFDEYFNPPTIVVFPVLVAAAPRAVDLANSLVSTLIDQDAPSTNSTSQGSSSNVRPIHTLFESLGRWTKDHPIVNVIGDPYRSVSTRKQLKTDAMWCYFDAFLSSVEPKNFKQAMTEPS
nr:hypothetical protein [Tanacetum cinerariifolium]